MKGRRRGFVRGLSAFRARRFGPLTLRFLTGKASFGGVSVVHERLPPRCRVPELYHRRTDELVLMLEGRVTATLNGRRKAVAKGDVLYLPAGTRHRFVAGPLGALALSLFSPPMRPDRLDVVVVEPRA